jgi:uncharacterized protein YndB with AHSA1/START domain
MMLAPGPATLEVYMRRELAAPRERVFAAWTDARLIGGWWAARSYTTLACTMDVRPGGAWSRRLMAPDGRLISEHGVYREVVAPQRLVFTYSSEGGAIVDRETLVTVTFFDRGERTVLTLRHSGLPTEEALALHDGGWARCLDRFTTSLRET